jgi:hypothetical protein
MKLPHHLRRRHGGGGEGGGALPQCLDMSFGEIHDLTKRKEESIRGQGMRRRGGEGRRTDMDIVPDSSPIRCVIIITKDCQLLSFSNSNLPAEGASKGKRVRGGGEKVKNVLEPVRDMA